MKQNKKTRNDHKVLFVALALLAAGAAVTGIAFGYGKVRDVWLEQCTVTDVATQVSINSGKMVKADVLAEEFGLKKGANLALIDFEAKRQQILKKIPNLRAISVTRRLPDKISIVAEERVPVARMGIHGLKAETGRVVDTEGVVFVWQRGTQTLPVIREPSKPGTGIGAKLTGRSLAALRLIEAGFEPKHTELGILEVDVSKPDYLLATLGNYSGAKVAWDGMDSPSPASQASLNRQLTMLTKAIRSRIGENTVMWNATDTSTPGCIYADSKGNL